MSETKKGNFDIKYRMTCGIVEKDLVEINLFNGEQMLSRWIMNTREKMIRESLMKLGWIPPRDDP